VARDEGSYQCDGPLHNFIELIHGLEETNHSPAVIGMRAVEILDAAYRSNASGKEEAV
jgi:predicted dehydrogenase